MADRSDGRLTCFSCHHYERTQHGPHEWHHKCREGHKELVPYAGSFDCESFTYEPGSDEGEGA